MTTALGGAVELLDRSLSYTRMALGPVDDAALSRPTPCARWDLAGLLTHMEDALDAFTEAAGGGVGGTATDPRRYADAAHRVGRLQDKACSLLGAWAGPTPGDVVVGGHDLDSRLLVATAALEITVHGWDVGRATGRGADVPEELARDLLGVAERVVHPDDRGVRFAAARPVPADASYAARLLGFLGRG